MEDVAPLVGEFVGTFMLTLTAGCCALGAVAEAWAPLAIASTLMVMIYALAPVSGAHLNPAVSFSLWIAGKEPWDKICWYIFVQICAGIAAGLSCGSLYGASVTIGPKTGALWWEAMVVEILYTAVLAFVVLGATATRNTPNQFFGLAIGFVIVAGGTACGGLSGAVLNPAVGIGLESSQLAARKSTDTSTWDFEGWYVVYHLAGACVAALWFDVTRPEECDTLRELRRVALPTKLAAEFIGTFVVVLTIALCTLAHSPATALGAGAALMSMIYAVGDVSGGHFNPAVTFAAVLCQKIDISIFESLAYMTFQLAAGFLACMLAVGLHKGETIYIAPRAPHTERAAYIMEAVFTLVLVLAVLSAAYAKAIKTPVTRNFHFALTVGFARVIGMVACGFVSGGALNPAVSIGFAAVHKLDLDEHAWSMYYGVAYSFAETLGAALAVVVFIVTHPKAYAPKRKLET